MSAFVTGSCLGLALGWTIYLARAGLTNWVYLSAGCLILPFFWAVVLPMATASGAMDMSLWAFTLYALDIWISDGLAAVLSWGVIFGCVSYESAAIRYKGFEPAPAIQERRDQKRRRLRAEMKYSDDYLG